MPLSKKGNFRRRMCLKISSIQSQLKSTVMNLSQIFKALAATNNPLGKTSIWTMWRSLIHQPILRRRKEKRSH